MVDMVTIYPVESGDIIAFEKIKVEFIRATHSIADACSLSYYNSSWCNYSYRRF